MILKPVWIWCKKTYLCIIYQEYMYEGMTGKLLLFKIRLKYTAKILYLIMVVLNIMHVIESDNI